MSEYTRNMYGFRTYEETPKFYISDLRPWPNAVHIFKGHSGDVMEYVPAYESDRLRELARFIMHQCNDGNPRCDECINWNGGECVVLQRMRELGVTDG